MTNCNRRFVGITDGLYRWRWWASAILVGAYIALGTSDAGFDPVTWALVALMLVLVWVPTLVRWFQAGRAARTAFREGYSDAPGR